MKHLGENFGLLSFPLNLFGMKMGRNVSMMKLSSGRLILHSTAPFSSADKEAILEFGEPGWLVEATNLHDTLARKGAEAYPDLPYLVPSGFPLSGKLKTQSLDPPPMEWENEVGVIRIAGMPSINEHVFYHHASKTLVVADLIFNIPDSAGGLTLGLLGAISGVNKQPGNSRMYRFAIKDRSAFEASLQSILALDFGRIVVGHGDTIESDARETLAGIFRALDFSV